MAKGPEFGKEFDEKSDLDFSIISSTLFELLVKASNLFREDYENGSIQPRNKSQNRLWPENIKVTRDNIRKGFLDSNKIPSRKRYSAAQEINNSMWLLKEKLEITSEAPKVRDASVRVYRDWKSFVDQVSLNLRWALIN